MGNSASSSARRRTSTTGRSRRGKGNNEPLLGGDAIRCSAHSGPIMASRRSDNGTLYTENCSSTSSAPCSTAPAKGKAGAVTMHAAPAAGEAPKVETRKPMTEAERRLMEAEQVLEEIAKEFAAKRAAGLVPTVPVPARTLLWEEMARTERSRIGKRGQCVYGRDTGTVCGCTTYKKLRIPGQDNPGGVCECCNHGAPWHRLTGGSNALRSRATTNTMLRSHASRLASLLPSEAGSRYSMEFGSEYDDDYDDDDDEDLDDDEIAMEMAVPYGYDTAAAHTQQHQPQPPPLHQRRPSLEHASLLSCSSVTSSFGLPRRLSSSTTNSLEKLLKAIHNYRQLGLSEDEIEAKIREDFPAAPANPPAAASAAQLSSL